MFEDAGHGAAVERHQPGVPGQPGDEPGVKHGVVLGVLDPVLEVGGDLEQLAELGILLGEHVIEHGLADDDDLDVERDGLGLEAAGADHAERLAGRLDADFSRPQGLLERVVGERLLEQLARIQDEVAAVGAVQRAGLDEGEVGGQRAHLREVLDLADQALVGGMILVDHRRAAAPAAIDHQVDGVAFQAGRGRG